MEDWKLHGGRFGHRWLSKGGGTSLVLERGGCNNLGTWGVSCSGQSSGMQYEWKESQGKRES